VFAATENPTLPLPVPDPPLVIVTHSALDEAVHEHVELEAVTVTVPLAPAGPKSWLVGEMLNVHAGGGGGGAAA
jgi:hypothetical protein